MNEIDKINVLVVDDEEIICNLLSRVLQRAGYNVTTAISGAQAIELLGTENFHVVITDIKMPEMNGFQLLKEIKDRRSTVAVVVMTAFADSYTIKDALLNGADEYITKPINNYEVTVVVERAYWRMANRTERENAAT